ncbi:MAG: NosD domain-containing protein [Patescibacteria group bacterium]
MKHSLSPHHETASKVLFQESVFWCTWQYLLVLLPIILLFTLPQIAKAQTSPYTLTDDVTGGDCILFGTWNESTKTCTMAANIGAAIVIVSDGITLDGNGHSLDGTGSSTRFGIEVPYHQYVTVQDVQVSHFEAGIVVHDSHHITLLQNRATENASGISVERSSDVWLDHNTIDSHTDYGLSIQFTTTFTLTENAVLNNHWGIVLSASTKGMLSGNTMTGAWSNFSITGDDTTDFDHEIDATNLVEGNPIRYYKNISDQVLDGATLPTGALYCISCQNTTFSHFIVSSSTNDGILLWDTHHSRIEHSTSTDNRVGIRLEQSNNNTLTQLYTARNDNAIVFVSSRNNTVTNATLEANTTALALAYEANDNTLTHNHITGTGQAMGATGVSITASGGNLVIENTMEDTSYNIMMSHAPSAPEPNQFFHNNLLRYYDKGVILFVAGPNEFHDNYWDGYDEPWEGCFDEDHNNICDAPYLFTGGQDNHPWTRQDGWLAQKEPVILIPGITGSWNWDVLFNDGNGGTWQFPPFTNVYQPLVEKLKEDGYEEGKTLFIAFYDWRQPNVISAQQYLKPMIDQAKQASGTDKVDIVGHSMGGILARAYIQGGHYEHDVDQLITLGTPHYGSGDAYTVWEGGHIPANWDIAYQVALKSYLFLRTHELGDLSRYNEIHLNILSLRDLLPTYDYLKDKTTNTIKLTNTLHEQNTFLNVFNPKASELNALVRTVTTIAGDDQYTVGEIPVIERSPQEDPLWIDGKPDPIDPERNSAEGDNTVLLSSAHLQEAIDQVTIHDTTHRDLVSKAAPSIFTRLGLPDPGTLELVAGPETILAFWFASPILPTVTDPEGHSISRDTSTITDAIYFGEDDSSGKKMILIPHPLQGQYHVDLAGIGEGHYDFATAFFKQDVPDGMQIFSGEVHEGEEITYESAVNPDDPEHPVATEIIDTEPPTLNIRSPQNGSEHLDIEILPLTLTGVDSLSGLVELNLSFDNTLIVSTTTTSTLTHLLDLSLSPLGSHTVNGTGKDHAGNTAVIEALFTSTTSYDAILQNLDHYESLGLLDPLAKTILTPQVKAAQKLAQQYFKRQHPRLKLALNKLLDVLVKEVQKLETRRLIHHPASLHLQEEFLALKL